MRGILKVSLAILATIAWSTGFGAIEAKAQKATPAEQALIMVGIGAMAQGIGTGIGNAAYGTNGTPLFVGGDYTPPSPWGGRRGNGWGGGGGYPGYGPQVVTYPAPAPQPYYPAPAPQPYYPAPAPQPYYPAPAPQPYYPAPAPAPHQQQNVVYSSGYSGYAPPVQYVPAW